MREILTLCVELDSAAHDVYADLSRSCPEPAVAALFADLADEERSHIEWWSGLLRAWESGLVPDIANEHDALYRLQETVDGIRAISSAETRPMSVDDALVMAAQLEFLLLDPVFDQLIELTQPGGRDQVRESFARHVERLIEGVRAHHSNPLVGTFLAQVLSRAHRDQQSLAAHAMHDQLTGFLDRRGLLGHLAQWLAWSQRYGRPVGIALVDVDNFKAVNDTLGHQVGDQALRLVAARITQALRTSDVVGRFGGDEFLVLVPEGDADDLRQLTSRIVMGVNSIPLRVGDREVPLTVTTGAAWAPGGIEVPPEALIAEADRSVYAAKASGRNRAGVPRMAAPYEPVAMSAAW